MNHTVGNKILFKTHTKKKRRKKKLSGYFSKSRKRAANKKKMFSVSFPLQTKKKTRKLHENYALLCITIGCLDLNDERILRTLNWCDR